MHTRTSTPKTRMHALCTILCYTYMYVLCTYKQWFMLLLLVVVRCRWPIHPKVRTACRCGRLCCWVGVYIQLCVMYSIVYTLRQIVLVMRSRFECVLNKSYTLFFNKFIGSLYTKLHILKRNILL